MFGGLGASKHAAGKTKDKTVTAKAGAKKSSHTHLAKKGEAPARTTGKTKTAKRNGSGKAKDKYSKGKSTKSVPIFASR